MPETFFLNWKKKFSASDIAIFLSAFIAGLLAHFYKFANYLPNWDGLVFRDDPQNMLDLGRFLILPFGALSTFLELPWTAGLISLLLHGLGALVIGRILHVEKRIPAILLGALVATFPTVTSIHFYLYVADCYAFAFFFSCLAARYLTKEKENPLLGALFLFLALGLYQAYLAVTICLILLSFMQSLLFSEEKMLPLFKKGLKALGSGLAACLLYAAVLFLLLHLTGEELLEYQGFSISMSAASFRPLASIWEVANGFRSLFFDFSGLLFYPLFNLLFLLATAILLIKAVWDNKAFRFFPRLLALGALVVALPFGARILVFVNPSVDYHTLMQMGYLVFYLPLLLCYENLPLKNRWEGRKRFLILSLLALLSLFYIVVANAAYHKAHLSYEKSYGVIIRLSERIDLTEGSENADTLLIIGAIPGSEAYTINFPPLITGASDSFIVRADDESVKQSMLTSTLSDYMGREFSYLSGEEKEAFLKKAEVEDMPSWPARDCIQLVDGILVIKMG